ncbi:Hypothetical protein NAEGRDRAFT_80283 [Naegleria gruberi]|uniref:Uncharacterized protein n=1 Tax=Naegleria gruberi TaxID=5762 RepID=D2VK95_NAEGR|nr:uncharacterized protein NAEGRDRAFT_80283 [Naegleria gruberi]EFC42911.1 Hypothetical protein NAEGRDRAFT_80283 [Naegleria gruberi]|eukprot:XP_002675655.1 Hypothetical protein NAEGRDRAFT_80283 [Naegleria gruberi strain NEG-M]
MNQSSAQPSIQTATPNNTTTTPHCRVVNHQPTTQHSHLHSHQQEQQRLFRVPMDRLFSIPLQSLVHKPHLYQFIVELRSRYVQHLLRTVSSDPLQDLKRQDNEVFCSHVSDIVKETEKLIEDMNSEEYLANENGDNNYYTTLGRIQMIKSHMKISQCLAPQTTEETTSFNPYEVIEPQHFQEIPEDEEEDDDDSVSDMSDDEETNQSLSLEEDFHSILQNSHSNHSLQIFENNQPNVTLKIDNSPQTSSNPTHQPSTFEIQKSEEISRQIQNSEPIKNGSLCFNQHHHIVVGKYDRDLLIKENRLKCCAMKKSTITIFAEKRNSRNGKVMKREQKAKSLLRFYRINVDFNYLVNSFIEKQALQMHQH